MWVVVNFWKEIRVAMIKRMISIDIAYDTLTYRVYEIEIKIVFSVILLQIMIYDFYTQTNVYLVLMNCISFDKNKYIEVVIINNKIIAKYRITRKKLL